MAPPRIVIDTNVVVSALRSRRGASHRILDLIDSGKYVACLSVPLFLEYQDACHRPGNGVSLTKHEVDDVLDYICQVTEHITIFFLWRPFLSDPSDDMILELAVAANCDAIVTFNRTDFGGSEQFGVKIIDPKEFLISIGGLP